MKYSKWTENEQNQIKKAHEKANKLFPEGNKLSIFRKKETGDLVFVIKFGKSAK